MSTLDLLPAHASTTTATVYLASEITLKVLDLRPLAIEREVIQLRIAETRRRIPTQQALDALFRDHCAHITAEKEFLGAEDVRARACLMNEVDPPEPHVKAALTHFLSELHADVADRLPGELDALLEMANRLREERDALYSMLEEHAVAFKENSKRWDDTVAEIVQTLQSLDEDGRGAVRNIMTEKMGENLGTRFWEFYKVISRKDEDSGEAWHA